MMVRIIQGSPPQVRGKRCKSEFVNAYFRITPAGAGKTAARAGAVVFTQDHPRRCGENKNILVCSLNDIGSPPQVRGKRRDSDSVHRATRITPAGAGKTRGCNRQFRRGGDHPRRCGENDVRECRTKLNMGSPPRMRGKLTVLL